MENLKSCIEKSIVTIDDRIGFKTRYYEFYYDSRFGTELDPAILHPAYKNCITSRSSIVTKVKSVKRKDNTFFVTVVTDCTEQVTIVKFYNIDKTFVCRSFDPREVIPAILADPECSDYLSKQGHPICKFGYVANYSEYPNATKQVVSDETTVVLNPSPKILTGDVDLTLVDQPGLEDSSMCDESTTNQDKHWYKRFLENLEVQQSKNLTPTDLKKSYEYFEVDQNAIEGNEDEPEQLDCDSCPADDQREMTADEIKEIENLFNKPDDDDTCQEEEDSYNDHDNPGAPFSHLPKKLKTPPKKILFRPDYESVDPVAVSSDEFYQSSDLPPGFAYIRENSPTIVEYIQEPDESEIPSDAVEVNGTNDGDVPDIYEEIRKAREIRKLASIKEKLFEHGNLYEDSDAIERFKHSPRMRSYPNPYGRPESVAPNTTRVRFTEQPDIHRMRIEMIRARILLQKKLSEIPPMDPIDLSIIPKLELRVDNIDDTSFSKEIILVKLDEYKESSEITTTPDSSVPGNTVPTSVNTPISSQIINTTQFEYVSETLYSEEPNTPDFR